MQYRGDENVDWTECRVGVCVYAGDIIVVRFYRDTLGFPTQWDGGDFAEFETASGAFPCFCTAGNAFAQAIGESYIPPEGINQTFEIALWLPCFADVDVEYERLSKLDVRFPTGEPKTFSFGVRNFYVADPEGNLLEIGSMRET